MATFIGNIGVPRIDRHIKFDPFGDMAAAVWRGSRPARF